jgi:RNA polymerase primary sigma factor
MATADAAAAQFWVEAAKRHPLLAPDEELHLGTLVQAWQQHPGGPDEAPPAVRRRGLRARDRIVAGNLRLVASFVQNRTHDGPLVDRFQNGALGLARAAEKFDPARGYKFSTYAYWWIRQAVSHGELAEAGIYLPQPVAAAVRGRRNGTCPPHLLAAGKAAAFVRSLDFVVPGNDRELTLGDTVAAPEPAEPDPEIDELQERMATLDPIEQRLIEGRWGLEGPPRNFTQLAAQEAISVAEVKLTIEKAMCKLRGQVYIEKRKRSIKAGLCVLADGTIHGHCGQWLGKAASQQEAERYCVKAGWRYEVIDPGAVTLRGRPTGRRRHHRRPR